MMHFNFGRKLRRVARRQHRRGQLDQHTYDRVVKGSKNPKTVASWKAAVESQVRGAPWLQEPDEAEPSFFKKIWDWFIANWPTILSIILSLLVFVDERPKTREESEITEEKPEEE